MREKPRLHCPVINCTSVLARLHTINWQAAPHGCQRAPADETDRNMLPCLPSSSNLPLTGVTRQQHPESCIQSCVQNHIKYKIMQLAACHG